MAYQINILTETEQDELLKIQFSQYFVKIVLFILIYSHSWRMIPPMDVRSLGKDSTRGKTHNSHSNRDWDLVLLLFPLWKGAYLKKEKFMEKILANKKRNYLTAFTPTQANFDSWLYQDVLRDWLQRGSWLSLWALQVLVRRLSGGTE